MSIRRTQTSCRKLVDHEPRLAMLDTTKTISADDATARFGTDRRVGRVRIVTADQRATRNSPPVSQRTSQSPTSARRAGLAIGANMVARRTAVDAPKRAAAIRQQQRPLLLNTLFSTLFAALRKALLAAFPKPLLGPFAHPFDERHLRILQRPCRRHRRARRRKALRHLPHPVCKRALQPHRSPTPQPALQRLHYPQHILGRPALLQPHHPTQQVAPRQIVRRHARASST